MFPHHWMLLPLCEMVYSDISASREAVWLQVEAVDGTERMSIYDLLSASTEIKMF